MGQPASSKPCFIYTLRDGAKVDIAISNLAMDDQGIADVIRSDGLGLFASYLKPSQQAMGKHLKDQF